MEIEVKLFAFLRRYLPKGSQGVSVKMQLKEPVSIMDVLRELKVPDEAILATMILMINGVRAEKEQILADGDVLTVFPVASGG